MRRRIRADSIIVGRSSEVGIEFPCHQGTDVATGTVRRLPIRCQCDPLAAVRARGTDAHRLLQLLLPSPWDASTPLLQRGSTPFSRQQDSNVCVERLPPPHLSLDPLNLLSIAASHHFGDRCHCTNGLRFVSLKLTSFPHRVLEWASGKDEPSPTLSYSLGVRLGYSVP